MACTVFYHDWGKYGLGKYGGISPKPLIFPGHNLTSASQNFPSISREFTCKVS